LALRSQDPRREAPANDEGRFMLAELEHAPKTGVRGDVFSPQIRRTGKPLLGPSTALRARYHVRYYDWFIEKFILG
jgi:hypothetical protein